jgi:hypothetical protein
MNCSSVLKKTSSSGEMVLVKNDIPLHYEEFRATHGPMFGFLSGIKGSEYTGETT